MAALTGISSDLIKYEVGSSVCYAVDRYYPAVMPGTGFIWGQTSQSYVKPGEKISVVDVMNQFIQDVTDKIMKNAIHSGSNIRSPYTKREVVPSSLLGSINSIPKPNVGSEGSRVTANTVYGSLVSLTRYLLRVGTYSYSEIKSVTGKWPKSKPSNNSWSSSGKALFSDAYASKGASDPGVKAILMELYNNKESKIVDNPNKLGNLDTAPINPDILQPPVVSINIMNSTELKELIERAYSSWSSSTRPHYTFHYGYCHSSCHKNCHSSCHSSCDSCNSGHGSCHNACYMNGGNFSPCHSGYCHDQHCNL